MASSASAVRRVVLAGVSVVALGCTSCSGTAGQVEGAHRGPTDSVKVSQDAASESFCSSGEYECEYFEGRLAIWRPGSSLGSPTVLWEPGGPGLNTFGVLQVLPRWAEDVNLIIIPEPWLYSSGAGCEEAAQPCFSETLSPREYGDVVLAAQHKWRTIDAAYGFSYGALRIAQLVRMGSLPGARFVISAPAPLPGTSGRTIGRLKLHRAVDAVRSAAGCEGKACRLRVEKRMDQLLDGNLGVPRNVAELGILGIATDIGGNRAAVREMFAVDVGGLSRSQTLALNRAAYTFGLKGRDLDSRIERRAYLRGMCRQYAFGPVLGSAFEAMHRTCNPNSYHPDDVGGDCSCDLRIFVNPLDPVIPFQLQRQWADRFPSASSARFIVPSHAEPKRSVLLRAFSNNGEQRGTPSLSMASRP